MSGGHIRQRGTGWAVVVELGRDSRDGRRRQRWVSGFATRGDAERALPRILRESEAGPAPTASSRQSVADFLRAWLATLPARGLRPTTIDGYRVAIETQLIPRIGSTPLNRLTSVQLNTCYGELLASGRRGGKRGLSPRTVRLTHTVLRKALADGMRWGQLHTNVAANADPPRGRTTPEMRIWSAAELTRFLATLDGHPMETCIWLLANTGMRRGEALGLRWRDIDFDHSRLSIVQTVIPTSEGISLLTTKNRTGAALDRPRSANARNPPHPPGTSNIPRRWRHARLSSSGRLAAPTSLTLEVVRGRGQRLRTQLDPTSRSPPHPRLARTPSRRSRQDRFRAARACQHQPDTWTPTRTSSRHSTPTQPTRSRTCSPQTSPSISPAGYSRVQTRTTMRPANDQVHAKAANTIARALTPPTWPVLERAA